MNFAMHIRKLAMAALALYILALPGRATTQAQAAGGKPPNIRFIMAMMWAGSASALITVE